MAKHSFGFMRFHTPDHRTPEELRRAQEFKRRLDEEATRSANRASLGRNVATSLHQRGIIWE